MLWCSRPSVCVSNERDEAVLLTVDSTEALEQTSDVAHSHCRVPCDSSVCSARVWCGVVPNAVAVPCGSPPPPRREACCRHCPSCAFPLVESLCVRDGARNPQVSRNLVPKKAKHAQKKQKKKKKQRQKDKCVSASILIAGCTLFLSKSFFSRCCCCGTTDFFPTSFSLSLPSSSPFPLERVRVCERVSVHQRACVRHDTAAADHTLPRQRERRDAAPRAAAARPPAARARQLCAV